MVTQLRWRIARLVAPEVIMRDPVNGKDGTFMVARNGGALVIYSLDAVRMRSSLRYRAFFAITRHPALPW